MPYDTFNGIAPATLCYMADADDSVRRAVEEKYDFEAFGPADMAEMTVEEWQAAFDPDTWITGARLLDRVEADLKSRVKRRDVFAVVERISNPEEDRILAYSDSGYAVVYPDGTVEGHGAVLRDVKPVVALCSMEDYDVPSEPTGELLPDPGTLPDSSSELGNRIVQLIGGLLIIAGLALLIGPSLVEFSGGSPGLLASIIGLGFMLVGIVLFVIVANARLSDRFRAAEYRDRLRAAGVGSDERPEFVPDLSPPESQETTDTSTDEIDTR